MSRHGQPRDADERVINSPRRAGPDSADPECPIFPGASSPHPRLTCQDARLLSWFDEKGKEAQKRAVDKCMLYCQAGRQAGQADRARPDVL